MPLNILTQIIASEVQAHVNTLVQLPGPSIKTTQINALSGMRCYL